MQGDQLAGMWTAALPLGLEGKMAALQAALEFIGTPPPPVASARTGNEFIGTPPPPVASARTGTAPWDPGGGAKEFVWGLQALMLHPQQQQHCAKMPL